MEEVETPTHISVRLHFCEAEGDVETPYFTHVVIFTGIEAQVGSVVLLFRIIL